MHLVKILFVTLLTLFMSFNVDAQERQKRRARERANQRVDQKVDQAVDKAADAIEGLFRRKDQPTPSEGETAEEEAETTTDGNTGFLGGLGIGGKFEPYENPIIMNISIDVTTTDKRGREEKIGIQYTFDQWQTGMAFQTDENDARIILDNQNGFQTVVTENDGEETAVRMRQRVVAIDVEDYTPDPSEYQITATGNTRVIDGYQCSEYEVTHEEGTSQVWITEDIDLDPMLFYQALALQAGGQQMAGKMQGSPATPMYPVEGFPIEITTTDQRGQTVNMLYKDIQIDNIDRSVFDIGGIEVLEMGF